MSHDDAFSAARMRSLVCLVRPTSHELRGALNAMQMHLELLSGALDEPPDPQTVERRRRYLDVIGDECRRLHLMVSAFLDLIAPPERAGETDPASLVAGIVDAVRPLAVERRVRLEFDRTGPQTGTPPDLAGCRQRVLEAIIDAVAAARTGSTVHVEVTPRGESATIAVEDGAATRVTLGAPEGPVGA